MQLNWGCISFHSLPDFSTSLFYNFNLTRFLLYASTLIWYRSFFLIGIPSMRSFTARKVPEKLWKKKTRKFLVSEGLFLPLRSKKAGRFDKLPGFARSQSIVTRVSVSLSCATIPFLLFYILTVASQQNH